MRIAPLLLIIVALLSSCAKKDVKSSSVNQSNLDSSAVELGDCYHWLEDSVLATGDYVKYFVDSDRIWIHWGNNHLDRTLKNSYDCEGAPVWVPTIQWATTEYIGLGYGCGTSCWGLIILPLNPKDSVVHRMYDLTRDTERLLIVYLDNEDYNSLVIENWATGQIQRVPNRIVCGPAFFGNCVDSLRFLEGKLYIKWDELDEQGISRRKIDEFVELKI